MLITLKSLLHTLLLPPGGPLMLAAAGALLAARRTVPRVRAAGWALLATGLATLWLLSMPVVGNALAHLAERYPALDLSRPVRAQAIVILAGGEAAADAPEFGGPAAGLELLARLNYGAFLARRTALPVLVSGSAREALVMRTVLARDFAIRTRWVDDESRDTFDDAHFSARLLKADGVRRILLVTSAGHEWRAAHEFASTGLEVDPAPVNVWTTSARGLLYYIPAPVALMHSSEALYEMLGDLVRRVLAATHLRRQAA
ncbi:MAG TPA: YdcF family protein [Steroidobacteraceae bacterium]|nr:YdcF family protein [Steroidobacteraceae bacterium]